MFRYVFGGAIDVPGIPYVDFLMPGIFVQTVIFGSMAAAIGLATDLKSGLIERFQSIPMSRSAVLAGRTLADLFRNVFVALLMTGVGFLVGFRVHTNPLAFVAGLGLVLLFGYTFAWIFATLGLAVGDPETAQAAAFPVIAPLVFASSAFVPVDSMPGWLRFRRAPAGVGNGIGRAGARRRGTHHVVRASVHRLVLGHPRRLRAAGSRSVPQDRLTLTTGMSAKDRGRSRLDHE